MAYDYTKFGHLDGRHPWQEEVPEGYINYPVRVLKSGKVAYFNFDLAKEMGLIKKDHPHQLNKKLEQKLIDTFSLRIINEYDEENKKKFEPSLVNEYKYMATRYLQLQHPNKQGKTSGDGRCIWNGVIKHKGQTWDVSSRGTGVTALAPGAVLAGKNLKSGSTEFGYGCGLAEIDELYSGAIMAEIMHNNQISTERMLAIIDLGGGVGIGVRAGKNLFRPAHLFLYLKQNDHEHLKKATDYLIDRQLKNKEWNFSTKTIAKYDHMLGALCENFARFVALLEREYIFAWLDWDGDNVLANAGIIDYGSIRQFGLRHDQYRYDDVERFSTNLNEQKQKARMTIQVFAQMVDYLKTKEKKSLQDFDKDPLLKKFDDEFNWYTLKHFLFQLGYENGRMELLITKHRKEVEELYQVFQLLERTKTHKKLSKVEDGVNRPAIYNLRTICRELPDFFLKCESPIESCEIPPEDLFNSMLAEHAGRKDKKMSDGVKQKILDLQNGYKNLLLLASKDVSEKVLLKRLSKRSNIINRADRITGNGLVFITDEIMKVKKRGMPHKEIQKAMDELINNQRFKPELAKHIEKPSKKLAETMLDIVEGYKESI